MNQFIFYVTVKIVVQSNETNCEKVIDEFQQETDYEFQGTDAIKVIRTEIMEASQNFE